MTRSLTIVAALLALTLAPLAPGHAQTTRPYPVEQRYIHSMAGQTLLELVRSLFPKHRKYWPAITDEFVRLNPNVFTDAGSGPAQGVRLRIPYRLRSIGVVTTLQGSAWVIDFQGRRRELSQGEPVYLGDEVNTAPDAHILLTAVDEAELELRPRSSLRFAAYSYRGKGADESLLELLRGGMRTITGKIGGGRPSAYRLVTRMATIGIRGTEYGVRLCGRDECPVSPGLNVAAAPGLYVSVLQGEIELRTRPTRRTVQRGDFFYVSSPSKPPQRLYEKPRLVFTEQELVALQEKAAPQTSSPLLTNLPPAQDATPRKAALSPPALLLALAWCGLAVRKRRR